MQASLALLGFVLAGVAAFLGAGAWVAAGAVLMIAPWPWTYLAIMPGVRKNADRVRAWQHSQRSIVSARVVQMKPQRHDARQCRRRRMRVGEAGLQGPGSPSSHLPPVPQRERVSWCQTTSQLFRGDLSKSVARKGMGAASMNCRAIASSRGLLATSRTIGCAMRCRAPARLRSTESSRRAAAMVATSEPLRTDGTTSNPEARDTRLRCWPPVRRALPHPRRRPIAPISSSASQSLTSSVCSCVFRCPVSSARISRLGAVITL